VRLRTINGVVSDIDNNDNDDDEADEADEEDEKGGEISLLGEY